MQFAKSGLAFSALTLLVGQQEGHLTVKTAAAAGNHAVFAYGSCCA